MLQAQSHQSCGEWREKLITLRTRLVSFALTLAVGVSSLRKGDERRPASRENTGAGSDTSPAPQYPSPQALKQEHSAKTRLERFLINAHLDYDVIVVN